jgi:hypothetical protein
LQAWRSSGFGVGAGSTLVRPHKIVDLHAQISVLAKLKLTNCAPISGLLETGLFYARAGQPAGAWETRAEFLARMSYEFESIRRSPQ